jgi:polysaccharide pyruvyl transferase CsaB
MPQSVVITGHYGFTNSGDEAILISMLAHLRELRADLHFTVLSGSVEATASEYGVASIPWADAGQMHRAVAAADLVLIGGGGLFHDYWGVTPETVLTNNHSGLSYFSGAALMASFYRKPVMLYAVGVGPLFSEQGKTITRVACDIAAAITVRDLGSKEVLESIGVPAEQVTVTADPAYAFPVQKDDEVAAFLNERRAQGPVIVVAPRSWSIGIEQAAWERELAAGLDLYLRDQAGSVLFVPFQRIPKSGEDDAESAARIRSLMQSQDRASILTRALTPRQIQTAIAGSDLVVGMRLHSTILAMTAGVPVVGLSYDPKVERIMGRAGLTDFTIQLDALRAGGLADTMGRALAEKRPVPAEIYASQARENARIAVGILDRARAGGPVERVEVRQLQAGLEQYRRESLIRAGEAKASASKIRELRSEIERAVEAHRQMTGALTSRIQELEDDRTGLRGEIEHVGALNRRLEREKEEQTGTIDGLREERARSSARIQELEHQIARAGREKADLQGELSATAALLKDEQTLLTEAEDLRARALKGLDQFHHRLYSALASYRSQRAWTVMIAIRKAYTLLKRKGPWALLKWSVGLPFKGAGDLHEFELDFPNVWDFIPERVQAKAESRQTETADALPKRKYDVIVFAIFDFEFRFQRPQQIAVQFARTGHRVFWISPSRFLPEPAAAPYEAVPLRESMWEVHLRGERPDLYGGQMTAGDARSYASSLEQLYRDFDISESACLLQFPYWRQAALALREQAGAKVVYDCMDDWQNWTAEPRINQFNLDEERRLARECDALVASSTGLCARHRAEGLDPLLVRNGADFEFFTSEPSNPPGLDVPKPIAGYYGAIANWFDLDLLTAVAKLRPQYSFVLIGQVHEVDVSRLKALPNVFLLGEKNYREIPGYLSSFDVALIPFKVNSLTSAVDPVKVYEYFSQGKPVVATDMAELQRAAKLLYIASGADHFAQQLDQALTETGTHLRDQRIDFARANTWAARVEQIDRGIAARYPLISILIVTYNCREFIGPCLDSILRNTSWPNFEVIVVDNHSSDGSGELADQRAASDARLRVIHHGENLGFAGANNLAAGSATGEYILFLNPDTLVTPGWIGRMMRHFEAAPQVGAVAAVTNFSGNETKINFDYGDLLGMEAFAKTLAAERNGQARDIDVAPLYCVLVPRPVWDEVGELDAGFEIGMFEDDDFSLRVKKGGYRVIAAEDCFIHHFGNGSFSKLPSGESLQIFEQNKQRFESKWSQTWQPHKLRPGVRAPHDEVRFTPDEFLRIDARALQSGPERSVLRRLHPATAIAGEAFNRQTDGSAAMVVECANATPGTAIVMGSTMLATSYGNPNLLSALVPAELYAKPARHPVHLVNDFGPSNELDFEVGAGE